MGVQRDTLDTLQNQSFVSYEQKDNNSHYNQEKEARIFCLYDAKQQIPPTARYTQRTTDGRKMS